MRTRSIIGMLLVAIPFCWLLFSCGTKERSIGEASSVHSTESDVSDVLLSSSYESKVRMHGKIRSICPDDGCWMIMSDNANNVRVEFSQHDEVIPESLMGSEVVVEGMLVNKQIRTNSPGFKAYQEYCGSMLRSSDEFSPQPVFIAVRMEYH